MSWVITGSEKTPVDPQFGSVSLLLHGNGTNGSTTITDSSPSPKTVTAVGTAQISTAIANQFGNTTGVIAFDGTGDGLTVPSSADFEFAGDFTVELWLRRAVIPNAFTVLFAGSTGSTQMFLTTLSNGTGLRWGLTGVAEYASANFTWSANQWYHVAVVRSSSNVKFYIDGSNISGAGATNSTSFSGNLNFANSVPGAVALNGFMDEIRITKGIARYAANFTPPTAPFPDI